jgi:uncharacterized membrane protein YqhA
MEHKERQSPEAVDRFSQIIGHSRYIVLLAVIAVLLVALSLFLIGTIEAISGIWRAWRDLFAGELGTTRLTVQFLEVVSVMLKAVVFYIIGVGLYSLFVAPLNITVSLGVQTLNDLEAKVVSVIVVILGVTFLEHFILWENAMTTLQFGTALALVVVALVVFQRAAHKAKHEQEEHHPDEQTEAQRSMFTKADERAEITPPQKKISRQTDLPSTKQ